ncbi:MAG: DUF255 domain-containing protein [Rhodospirillales bacterium]
MRLAVLILSLILAAGIARGEDKPAPGGEYGLVHWQEFSDATFQQAAREKKYVLLHMAAVWCHWCHVMEQTTYSDPKVLALIEQKFIPVRVDQDARPDLSYRYERWGWPATIMLDQDGNEIFRRQGYQPPKLFAKLLQAVIDDPSPLPDANWQPVPDPNMPRLTDGRKAALDKIFLEAYDKAFGGFGDAQRYLQIENVEYASTRLSDGSQWHDIVQRTLAGARQLIDPVWGGMYQYSEAPDWTKPHYEKLLNVQLAAARLFSQAYVQLHDPADLKAAKAIGDYLLNHMRGSQGAFYASQDADVSQAVHGKDFYALDDAARRKTQQPRIDTNLYARENGWAISALAAYYDVSNDTASLDAAVAAAKWIEANRKTPGGGFAHGNTAETDAYLADNIAMAEAFLALYRSTGDRTWLDKATQTARYIVAHFADAKGGFVAQQPRADARGMLAKPVKQIEENTGTVRLLNLLATYTGDTGLRDAARQGMAYLAAFAAEDFLLPGVLTADRELGSDPVHITIVGRKDDAGAAQLYAAARAYPTRYLRIEWWDRREGKLPNNEIEYPEFDQPAAFACAQNFCSLPVFDAAGIAAQVDAVAKR